MSGTTTVETRDRSGSGIAPPKPPVTQETGTGVIETTKTATKLFETVGKNVKIAPPRPVRSSPNGTEKERLSPEQAKAALAQRKYWYDQIRVTTAAITYANGFRKRLKTYAPGPDVPVKELMECSASLDRLRDEVHGEVVRNREGLKGRFKDSKDQRAKYEKLNGELSELEKRLDAYPIQLTMPGGKEGGPTFFQTKVAPGRKTAELHYQLCHFDTALEELQKVHDIATAQIKLLDKADGELRGTLGRGPFVAAYKALDKLNEEIAAGQDVAGLAAVAPFRKAADFYYSTMIQAVSKSDNKNEVKQLGEKLPGTIEAKTLELQQSLDARRAKKISLDNAVSGLQRIIVERGPVRPQSELDDASGSLDDIRALMARFDYAAAQQKVTDLSKLVLAWEKLPAPNEKGRKEEIGKQAVALFLKPAEAEQLRAEKFAKLVSTIPVLETPPTPQSVIDMLQTQLDIFRPGPDEYPVSQGIDTVARARALNDTFQKRIDDYAALAELREHHNAEVGKLLERTQAAIDEFKAKLAKAGTKDASLPTYDAPLERAKAEWDEAMRSATDVTDLDEVFASVSLQLTQLQQQVEADIEDPDKLMDATLDARLGALDKAFQAADERARTSIDELIEVDYDKGDTQSVAAEAARDQFIAARKKQDVKGAAAALAALEKAADLAAEQAEAGTSERAGMLRQFFEANNAIAQSLAKLNLAAKTDPCKDYAAILAALAGRQVMIGRLRTSQDASAIKLALEDLKALQAECDKLSAVFAKLTTKGVKPAPGDLTIENLKKRLDDTKLNDATVKEYEAAALNEISTKKDTVTAAVGTIPLGESDQQIKDFVQEWADLKAKALKHKGEVTVFRADIATTLKDFMELTDKKVFKAYWESMTGRLNALDTAADKQKLTDQKALDEIKRDIAFNNSSGKGGLQRANDACEAAAMAEELEKQQFIVELGAFEGRMKALDAVMNNIEAPSAR
jgi:hypothetical protein